MNKNLCFTFLAVSFLSLTGCKLTQGHTSKQMTDYKAENGSQNHLGQVRFLFDDLGTLNLKGLMDTRLIPTKLYNTALIIAEEQENNKTIIHLSEDR